MPAFLDFLPFSSLFPLIFLAFVYAAASVFNGFAGFGFSAIGYISLTVVSPTLGIALLMALSLAAQVSGFKNLWPEMREHAGSWKQSDGVVPYLIGGLVGLPIGLKLLSFMDAKLLTIGLGGLLMMYGVFCALKPSVLLADSTKPSPWTSVFIGAAGGLVGGFAAFPGSAMVVWNSLLGKSKHESRALAQPFILLMQTTGLLLIAVTHPETFDQPFWTLFFLALPIALMGNCIGIEMYRKIGDVVYRRVTPLALSFAGAGLVVKALLF